MNLNKFFLKLLITLMTKRIHIVKEKRDSMVKYDVVKKAYGNYIKSMETTLMYLNSDLKSEETLDRNNSLL